MESKSQSRFDLITDLTENQPKRFFISSNMRKPVSIEKVDIVGLRNTKYNNDVIVITHSKLKESAKKYKDYREANSNLSVGIFDVKDIYNEYNAGTMDITAIRDFIAQAMINWDVKPSYVLLWGDGHYDYREILTTQTNFIPPHLSEDQFNNFEGVKCICTDDFYVRVVGNDKALDLAIGRITINSEQEGNTIVEKIKHYENNSSIDNWRNKITLVADDGFSGNESTSGDGSLFVDHSEDFSNNRVPGFMEQRKI
ncbi:MAG: C25 family cysteine peptidase, partial [Candidatus Kapaibacterium sp.]